MITSTTQQIEHILEQLAKPWTAAAPQSDILAKMRQQVLDLANDRADARELADERAIIIQQQAQALGAQIGHIAQQDRRLRTILLTCGLDAPAETKIDAIREIFSSEQ